MEDNNKPAWQSKTLWMAALCALLPLIPGVGPIASAWIAANPALFTVATGAVFGGLRVVSKGKVTIS